MTFAEPFDIRAVIGPTAGATLCVVGGVHGNEPAGVRAVEELRARYPSGDCLRRGRLITLVANSCAVHERRRAIDFDLNRAFGADGEEGHEATLAALLAPQLAGADVVLDLHSTSAPSPVFAAGAESDRHLDFCHAVGAEFFTYGWSAPRQHTMLVDEADRQGAVGLLVECGQHRLARTEQTALGCALRALEWLGMVDPARAGRPAGESPCVVQVSEIVQAERDPLYMNRNFHNFELVRRGTEVCRGNSMAWRAPRDFLILIPARRRVAAGEDAFAVGDRVTSPLTDR